MRKKAKPTNIGDIFSGLFKDMQAESHLELGSIQKSWQQVVGDKIACRTSPATIRKGVLFVNVTSSMWVQELHFLRGAILEKLNATLKQTKLTDIRFSIGTVPGAQHPSDREPLPELSQENSSMVAKESSAIKDHELRDSFQSFMSTYLKNKQKKN